MSIRLDGKRVIVTGAATGIGRASALRLLEAGARVALWDRNATPSARLWRRRAI